MRMEIIARVIERTSAARQNIFQQQRKRTVECKIVWFQHQNLLYAYSKDIHYPLNRNVFKRKGSEI